MLSLFLYPILLSLSLAECPPGAIFESNFNKCYKYYKTKLPFLAAEKQCNSIGGNLASISNAFENSFVSGIAGAETSSAVSYWVGASLLLASKWSWTDNSTFVYNNWAFGEPEPSKACAYVQDVNSQWITTICSTSLSFMCNIDPNAPTFGGSCTTQPPVLQTTSLQPTNKQPSTECTAGSSVTCPPSYQLFTGNCRCYQYIDHFFTEWDIAQTRCTRENATLPKIDSQELNDFLVKLAGPCYPYECPWIGLHCTNGTVSSCRWADGSPLERYTNFATTPTHPSNGDYFYVLNANTNGISPGGWRNASSYEQTSYFCETAGVLSGEDVALSLEKGGKQPVKS